MALSIRARLLAAFLVIAVLSTVGLSYEFLTELQAFAVRKLDERVDAQAQMIATFREVSYAEEGLATSDAQALMTEALARVSSPSRMQVIDLAGNVVSDSRKSAPHAPAAEILARPEVRAALGGERSSLMRSTGTGRIELFVAYPIHSPDGRVIGASYASAETFSIRSLIAAYQTRLDWFIVGFTAMTILVIELLSRWLATPLLELQRAVARFGRGEHGARATLRGSRETRALASSFNVLADEVETAMTELRSEEQRKSRFVSDVSHELRTPLTAIRGAAETLMEDDVAADDRARFLSTIVSESDRLTRLANDLLILQRIEGATGELPLRRIDLGTVVRHAIDALEPLMEERGVTVSVKGEAPEVLGDVDRIQQVVGNLVDNASRVSPAGTSIAVRLGKQARWATIVVADSGPGIPADDLPHVFERFYRSQPSRARRSGGVGLGLSIVKAIVEAHGGNVAVANGEDSGAVFTVRLPALEPPVDEDFVHVPAAAS